MAKRHFLVSNILTGNITWRRAQHFTPTLRVERVFHTASKHGDVRTQHIYVFTSQLPHKLRTLPARYAPFLWPQYLNSVSPVRAEPRELSRYFDQARSAQVDIRDAILGVANNVLPSETTWPSLGSGTRAASYAISSGNFLTGCKAAAYLQLAEVRNEWSVAATHHTPLQRDV